VIAESVRTEILGRLAEVELSEHVRILLAIESGSRAWGFASTNSDYDVRFIYCRHEPWYLSVDLETKRDVLEYGVVDDIDLNGWDLRKALRLLWKSNPAIVEWLQFPIQYLSRGAFRSKALAALPSIYVPGKDIYHYRSMAKTNFRGYLRADRVPLKKYFYVLRPLLAARWVQAHNEAAPIEFEKLLSTIADHKELLSDIASLLDKKKSSAELDLAPPIPRINKFIEAELERLDALTPDVPSKRASPESLNMLFRSVVAEPWEA
jgi:Predicted nucleotidyltransferase